MGQALIMPINVYVTAMITQRIHTFDEDKMIEKLYKEAYADGDEQKFIDIEDLPKNADLNSPVLSLKTDSSDGFSDGIEWSNRILKYML